MDLLCKDLESDMLTLAAPLSREVEESFPKVREFWWDLSLGSHRGMGAEFIRRGIATRYEKRAANYRAMVTIAAILLWL
jgi:hypothetical protein